MVKQKNKKYHEFIEAKQFFYLTLFFAIASLINTAVFLRERFIELLIYLFIGSALGVSWERMRRIKDEQ